MADQERLSKKERRERSREERKRKEAEARKKAQRQRLTTIAASVLAVLVIGAVVVQALVGGSDSIAEAIEVSRSDVEAARAAAGCEVIDERTQFVREHYDPGTAPPADALYGSDVRPTHGGPHYNATAPLVTRGANSQLEERATTHNLEHGAVIAWYDPEQVDGDTIEAMEGWSETLNGSGFANDRSGAGIFVSPYTDPGISSGKAIALRAWGIAIDCDTWDETAANGLVIDRFGSHGSAPERNLAPYPEDVMRYVDGGEDDAEAPTDDTTAPATETPAPDGTPSPTPTE